MRKMAKPHVFFTIFVIKLKAFITWITQFSIHMALSKEMRQTKWGIYIIYLIPFYNAAWFGKISFIKDHKEVFKDCRNPSLIIDVCCLYILFQPLQNAPIKIHLYIMLICFSSSFLRVAKLDGVKTYMRIRRVPKNVQNKVIKWFDYLWLTQNSSDEERAIQCLPGEKTFAIFHLSMPSKQ